MAMIIIFSALLGAVLGTRFKVFILLPVSGCGMLAAAIGGMTYGASLAWSLMLAGAVAVALQLGYLGGLATRFVMVAARLRTLRDQSVPGIQPRR
jgi:hypothetical protein